MYVMICTAVYFVTLLKNACHAVAWRKKEQHKGERCGNCKHFILFFTVDAFNLLDLICCVMVMVTMFVWYGFMTLPFSGDYFFSEVPLWQECHTTDWCSDRDVISYFSIIA